MYGDLGSLNYNGMDFGMEIAANWKLVLANFGFWSATAPPEQRLAPEDTARTLSAVATLGEGRAASRIPDHVTPARAVRRVLVVRGEG